MYKLNYESCERFFESLAQLQHTNLRIVKCNSNAQLAFIFIVFGNWQRVLGVDKSSILYNNVAIDLIQAKGIIEDENSQGI